MIKSSKPGRGSWLIVAAIVFLGIAILFSALLRPATPKVEEPSAPQATPTVTSSPSSSWVPPSREDSLTKFKEEALAWQAGMSTPVVEWVSDRLGRCDATLFDATEWVSNIGSNYPRTVAGAVAFAADVAAFRWTTDWLVDAKRHAVETALYAPRATMTDEYVGSVRSTWGLDQEAKPLNGGTFYIDAYPEYGAYNVPYANLNDTGAVEVAYVTWMLPSVSGIYVGAWEWADKSHIVTSYGITNVAVMWGDSGWTVWDFGADMSVPGYNPDPDGEQAITNPGYSNLDTLLPDGWCVASNATQTGDDAHINSK